MNDISKQSYIDGKDESGFYHIADGDKIHFDDNGYFYNDFDGIEYLRITDNDFSQLYERFDDNYSILSSNLSRWVSAYEDSIESSVDNSTFQYIIKKCDELYIKIKHYQYPKNVIVYKFNNIMFYISRAKNLVWTIDKTVGVELIDKYEECEENLFSYNEWPHDKVTTLTDEDRYLLSENDIFLTIKHLKLIEEVNDNKI